MVRRLFQLSGVGGEKPYRAAHGGGSTDSLRPCPNPVSPSPYQRRFFSKPRTKPSMLSHWMLVAVGGAAGAVLRFYLSETIPSDSFPWATLSVNLLGSFLLGIVAAAGLVQVNAEPLDVVFDGGQSEIDEVNLFPLNEDVVAG